MIKDFEKSMMENDGITKGEFYSLIHETYDEISKYMTKSDFARWLDKSRISEKLKTLIVEAFNEEDHKEMPGGGGYFNRVKNLIKFKDKSETTRRVSDHENMHFISAEQGFPTFLDEGLTEYISRAVKGQLEKRGSYEFNVRTVKFLHFVLGDSLIKNYLSGVTPEFKEYASTFLTPDGEKNLSVYSDFMSELGKYHDNAYTIWEKDKKTPERDAKAQEALTKINEYLLQMAKNYIRREVHSLEYLGNGSIDISLLNGKIATVKRFLEGTCSGEFKDENLLKELRSGILETELAKALTDEFLFDSPNRDGTSASIAQKIARGEDISKDLKLDSPDLAMRLAENRLKGYSEKRDVANIPKMLSELQIIFEKTGATDFQREAIIGEKLFKAIPDGVDFSIVRNNIERLMPSLATITQEKRENDAHTRTTEYLKISSSIYIQKTDNEFYHVTTSNGTIKKQRIDTIDSLLPEVELKRTFTAEDILKAGEGAIAYRTPSGGRILVSKDLEKVFTSKVLVSSKEKIPSMEAFMEELYAETMMGPFRKQIREAKYRTIMSDAEDPYFIKGLKYSTDVDMRSRRIKTDEFIKDLKSYLSVIPEGKRDTFAKFMITELVKSTFGRLPDDAQDAKKQLEEAIYKKYTLSRKIDSVDENLSKLEESLNGYRRSRVEEDSKTAMVEVPKDKQVVYRIVMDRRKKEMEERSNKSAVSEFFLGISDYITAKEPIREETQEEPESERIIKAAFRPVIGYVGPITATRLRTIDFGKLSEGIKATLDRITPEAREKAFDAIITRSLSMFYGPEKSPVTPDKKTIFDGMREAIKKNVFEGEELDQEFFSGSETRLHEIIKEEYEDAQSKSAIYISDPESRVAYSAATRIANNKQLSEDVKVITIKEILRFAMDEKNPCHATVKSVLEVDKGLVKDKQKEDKTTEEDTK